MTNRVFIEINNFSVIYNVIAYNKRNVIHKTNNAVLTKHE